MARFNYFQGRDRLWYWRLIDGNNKIVAVGGEGYASESNVLRALQNVQSTVEEINHRP